MNNKFTILILMSFSLVVVAGTTCSIGMSLSSVIPFTPAGVDMPSVKPTVNLEGFALVAPATLSTESASGSAALSSTVESFDESSHYSIEDKPVAISSAEYLALAFGGVEGDVSAGGSFCSSSEDDYLPGSLNSSRPPLRPYQRPKKTRADCACGLTLGVQIIPGGALCAPWHPEDAEYCSRWMTTRLGLNILSENIVELKNRMVDYPCLSSELRRRPWATSYKKTSNNIKAHYEALRLSHLKIFNSAWRLFMGKLCYAESSVSWFDHNPSGDDIIYLESLRCWKCNKVWEFDEFPKKGICNEKIEHSSDDEECGANLVLPPPESYVRSCGELQSLSRLLKVAVEQSQCALELIDKLDAMDLSQ